MTCIQTVLSVLVVMVKKITRYFFFNSLHSDYSPGWNAVLPKEKRNKYLSSQITFFEPIYLFPTRKVLKKFCGTGNMSGLEKVTFNINKFYKRFSQFTLYPVFVI